MIPTPKARSLDGFTNAHPMPGGMVKLTLWPELAEDPEHFTMTPGQALKLIQELASAAQAALTMSIKG